MENQGLIYKKMSLIQGEIEAVEKNRNAGSGGFSYKFRGIDDMYNALNKLMAKHSVTCAPKVVKMERHERDRVDKQGIVVGVMIHVILNIQYTFYAEDGSNIVTELVGEGSDTGDKATNKAMSAAHKYCLMQCFIIPTDEPKDPEIDQHDFGTNQKYNTANKPLPVALKPIPNSADDLKKIKAEDQVRLLTIAKQNNWKDDEVNDYLSSFIKVSMLKDLSMKQAKELAETLKTKTYLQATGAN